MRIRSYRSWYWSQLWSRVQFAWARLRRSAVVHSGRKLALKMVVAEYRQEMPVTRCPCGHLMRWTPYYVSQGLSSLRHCPVCKRKHFAKLAGPPSMPPARELEISSCP